MSNKIPFSITKHLSSFIEDYINQNEKVLPFQHLPPTLDTFEKAILNHKKTNREVLVKELLIQNKNGHQNTIQNINLLNNNNTFTVTTGHQICLFTGPLYFIYKIITTLNLAKQLNNKYPTYNFIPVYWMATEDHDFEEINHINLFGNKIEWKSNQTGGVGRFKLNNMDDFLIQLKSKFNNLPPVLDRIVSFYETSKNLAQATIKMVNELFGKYGLVTIDGDNKNLKELAIPVFKEELTNQSCYNTITNTNKKLEALGYKKQINPRKINLFYLKGNIRERIEINNGRYQVLHTTLSFSKEEIITELQNHPDRFSPNVALRPIYQEAILPNLANIGGPGETAYWLQLKSSFNHFNVDFPILVLRNSVLLLKKAITKKMNKLNLTNQDLFKPTDVLIKNYIKEVSNISFEEEIKSLEQVFTLTKNKATQIDFSLEKTVIAELKKAQNAINMIQSKTIKAEKKNNEIAIAQIESIKKSLFPNNSFQERVDNLFNYYNDNLIKQLITETIPLDYNLLLINS